MSAAVRVGFRHLRELGLEPRPPRLVLAAVATFLLTLDRSPGLTPIAGVPYVVPVVLVLLIAFAFGAFFIIATVPKPLLPLKPSLRWRQI